MRRLSSLLSKAVGILHAELVYPRRAEVLSRWFAEFVPRNVSLLDVGCGDGLISARLQLLRPDIAVRGIDVLPRDRTNISVEVFDGTHIPFADACFDVVLFSDVLHHAADPACLLREGRRVAARAVLIKDHYRKGLAAGWRLRLADWVGNARFGVALPYNFWTEDEWQGAWRREGLRTERIETRLGLYPPPVDWVFGAELNFIARLQKCDPAI